MSTVIVPNQKVVLIEVTGGIIVIVPSSTAVIIEVG